MDVTKILADLRQEREQIEQAILSLEMLARGRGRKRGRPPAWMAEITAKAPKKRGRPAGSKNKASSASNTTAVARHWHFTCHILPDTLETLEGFRETSLVILLIATNFLQIRRHSRALGLRDALGVIPDGLLLACQIFLKAFFERH